jgi:putative peptidoglycan lipid II flippase
VSVSIMAMLLNVTLNLILVRTMGYKGLALGTALAALANGGTLLWLLSRRIGGLEGARVTMAALKISLATAVMAAATVAAVRTASVVAPGSDLGSQLIRVGGGIGLGLATLALSARALRIHEFSQAVELVRSKLARTRAASR